MSSQTYAEWQEEQAFLTLPRQQTVLAPEISFLCPFSFESTMFSSNWVFLVSHECSGKTGIKEEVFSFINPWRGYFVPPFSGFCVFLMKVTCLKTFLKRKLEMQPYFQFEKCSHISSLSIWVSCVLAIYQDTIVCIARTMIILFFVESQKTVIVAYQHIISHLSRLPVFSEAGTSTLMLFFKNCYFNLILNDFSNNRFSNFPVALLTIIAVSSDWFLLMP